MVILCLECIKLPDGVTLEAQSVICALQLLVKEEDEIGIGLLKTFLLFVMYDLPIWQNIIKIQY